ncbi:DesA family fatty acid desaturase [Sedimenticola sp.]|uniref:DesA family fatty acid desaturase n=1 Tax=Sedimenticola sp. TaxID=1940285 RepID=UPI003D0DC059
MFSGLLQLPVWGYVVTTAILTHITIIAVTLFLHRSQTHRTLDLHPALSHFFRFWLWLTSGMITREWVAIHRKHHAKCDTEQDPHSPQVRGLRAVLWRGAELYQTAAADREMVCKYGKGTPDDWLERHLYTPHHLLGIGLMAAIDLLLFGPIGLTIWAVQMIWVPFWAAGVINGIGHYWGYRNFDNRDAAVNIVPWGILVGGEELHNNHHAFLNSAKLSNRPWEFDIGWFYIRLLERLGLARARKFTRRPRIGSQPAPLDIEAVKTLTTHRIYLFADYQRHVLRPMLQVELKKVSGTLRRLYKRAGRRLLNGSRTRRECPWHSVEDLLNHSPKLRAAHDFRDRLESIWEEYATTQEWRLQALRDWCAEAEASGIELLHRFALLLRSYQPAQSG